MKALNMRLTILVPVLSVMCATPSAASETTIGRWCDRMLPNNPKFYRELEIKVNESGGVIAHSQFGDGSALTQNLSEQGGSIFVVNDSPSGDRYRVVPSGDLQLLDSDGLIRVAARLENIPQPGDCLRQ